MSKGVKHIIKSRTFVDPLEGDMSELTSVNQKSLLPLQSTNLIKEPWQNESHSKFSKFSKVYGGVSSKNKKKKRGLKTMKNKKTNKKQSRKIKNKKYKISRRL